MKAVSGLTHGCRDESYDWTNKRIAVIGNGSSALQLIPQLQQKARKIVNYSRSPTWVIPPVWPEVPSANEDLFYSEDQRRAFREDPNSMLEVRKKMEQGYVIAIATLHALAHQ
jgi:siroheme synthase (precorrin-2 oxidase/ferrochelatase)